MTNANVEMNEKNLEKKKLKKLKQKKKDQGKRIEKKNEREKGWQQEIKNLSDMHELERWQ